MMIAVLKRAATKASVKRNSSVFNAGLFLISHYFFLNVCHLLKVIFLTNLKCLKKYNACRVLLSPFLKYISCLKKRSNKLEIYIFICNLLQF